MPRPTTAVAVRHPVSDAYIVLDPRTDYADDDVLLDAYPWAFVPPAENATEIVESVRIERATAEPGERRRVGRPRTKK
jgi:hypothetical protein